MKRAKPRTPSTSTVRMARVRAARAKAGGKQIAVWLSPEAAARLTKLTAKGDTIATVVNRLILRTVRARA